MSKDDKRIYTEWRLIAQKAAFNIVPSNVYIVPSCYQPIAVSIRQPFADMTMIKLSLTRAVVCHHTFAPSLVMMTTDTAKSLIRALEVALQDQHVVELERQRHLFSE